MAHDRASGSQRTSDIDHEPCNIVKPGSRLHLLGIFHLLSTGLNLAGKDCCSGLRIREKFGEYRITYTGKTGSRIRDDRD